MVVTLGRQHAGLVEKIDEFGVRHCVVPGVNAPDPQSDLDRRVLCQKTRNDVMWPGIEIGKAWHYKCRSCSTAYYCTDVNVDAQACARCGGDWREPDWRARKKLQNLLDSDLNGNGERLKDIGELLVQSLLDTGEAYLVRSGNYSTDESGNVSEKPVELSEPERRAGTHGAQNTPNYWVPAIPFDQFIKTGNEFRHFLGLPSDVVFCVHHRNKAHVGKSACPECDALMIDAYGYVRAPRPDSAQSHNDINLKYFGEREVLGYSGWHCQIEEANAGCQTDYYDNLGNCSKEGVDTVNSIRTLLNEKFFGPLAEGIVGPDTGFTLEIPLAVDKVQRQRDATKVAEVVARYKDEGYRHALLPDGTFMIMAASGKTDNSA